MLLARPGELVTREEIQQDLWPSGTFVDFDNGLHSAVNRLRDVLGDSAEQPRFIQTIPRLGYRFLAPVESVNGHASSTDRVAVGAPVEERPQRATLRPRFWLWAASTAAVALGGAVFAGWQHYHATKVAVNFKARDWALIASFENRTGNPVFDGTIEYALARELSNSQYVTVVSPERVGDALRLMKKPSGTRVDVALGREICLRDGDIRMLLAGRVEKLGTVYVLSAQLIDPVRDVAVATLTEEDPADSQMSATVRRLSDRVRETLGEKRSLIQQSENRLEKVTTPSLHALQLYSKADALLRLPGTGQQAVAAELLERAITEDPSFASAHLLLGWTYGNRGLQAQSKVEFQRAFELADSTSERERFFILGSYYEAAKNDLPKAIEAYEALLRLYPDHYWAANNLEGIFRSYGKWNETWRLALVLADLRPDDLHNNEVAACGMYLNGNPEGAKPHIARVRSIAAAEPGGPSTDDAVVQTLPVYYGWAQGDVGKAWAQLRQLEKSSREFDDPFVLWSFGELAEADKRLQKDVVDDPYYNTFLGMGAYIRGDLPAARKYFERFRGDDFGWTLFVVMGRAGMWDRVEAALSRLPDNAGSEVVRGELAIARGQTDKGVGLLERGLEGMQSFPVGAFYLGSETLAQTYVRKGNFKAALRVLLRAANSKTKAAYSCVANGGMSGAWWLRNELQLAHLYRKMGRVREAEQVEGELRKMLIYADADHPILLALKKAERSGAS